MTANQNVLSTLSTVSVSQLAALIKAAFHARQPILALGDAGIGKTEVFRAVAAELAGELFERRMLRYQPTDINGIPFPNKDKTATTWLAADFFPSDSFARGIFLVDEVTACLPAMQAAIYSIFEATRGTENYSLPADVVPMAAGNIAGRGAVAFNLSNALTSRFAQIYHVQANADDWCAWAMQNGVKRELVYHIKARPEMLSTFDPKSKELPFACPRSITNLSAFLEHCPPEQELTAFASACGEAYAHDLKAFLTLWRNLPSIEEIILNPTGARLPDKMDVTYCVSAALAKKASPQNFGAILQYIDRFKDREFSIFVLRDATTRNPALCQTTDFQDYVIRQDIAELMK